VQEEEKKDGRKKGGKKRKEIKVWMKNRIKE